MFRQNKSNETKHHAVSELDLKTDTDRASIVFLIRQDAMNFGSNRASPVHSRPAILIRHRDGFWFVLPCTTHKKSAENPEFFAISKSDVMWTHPDRARDSSVFYRYESVSDEDLIARIGMLYPVCQVDIVKWLRSRY